MVFSYHQVQERPKLLLAMTGLARTEFYQLLDTFHFPFPLCSHFQDGCLLKKDWEFSDVVLV
jgi:hypothetical protein